MGVLKPPLVIFNLGNPHREKQTTPDFWRELLDMILGRVCVLCGILAGALVGGWLAERLGFLFAFGAVFGFIAGAVSGFLLGLHMANLIDNPDAGE